MPHGLASIKYEHPGNDSNSFNGVGIFNNGKLQNTPFSCINRAGWGFSLTKMQNGRPADGSYLTLFNGDGRTQNVESLETETDVSGW